MFYFRLFLLSIVFVQVFFNGVTAAPWTVNGILQTNDYELNKNFNVHDKNNDYPRENEDISDEYHSYMEKKVAKIIQRGAVYLEGLRRALQNYTDKLDNCTEKYKNINYTEPTQLAGLEACQKATAESERVRRVTQLALWTTRLIQERGYVDQHREDELEDKMLLLRLSWLLDRLAHMTGYEPKAEDYLTAAPSATTNQPANRALGVNVSDEVKMNMIRCLDKDANSTQPAYERCPSLTPTTPPPSPPMRTLSNLTDTTSTVSGVADTKTVPSVANEIQDLITSSSIITKTSHINIDKTPGTETRDKRWRRENTQNGGGRNTREDYLTSRIPEDPAQDISGYVKSKEGTNTNINPAEAAILRASLERTYQTPNQEISRRYGANYNPLVPNTVFAGIVAGGADI